MLNRDLDKIGPEQKQLYSALVEWRPEFKEYCKTEVSKNGEYNLLVELPSPTGDAYRNIVIWVEEGDISIEFGPWHTHESEMFETDEEGYYEDVTIIDLVKMIISNEIVYFIDIGGEKPFSDILNLKYKNAIASLLTDIYSSGEIDIRSWDGSQDKRVSLKDLTL